MWEQPAYILHHWIDLFRFCIFVTNILKGLNQRPLLKSFASALHRYVFQIGVGW